MTVQPPETKPKKKKKWYRHILGAVYWLWLLGGLNTLLLQDIPLLLFLLGVGFALIYPSLTWFPGREELKGEPWLSWRRLWAGLGGIVWGLFVGAATIALLLFVIPPFAISPQTTYLTAPRSTELYGIDYQSVIEQQLDPGVPPEDNGFRLLTKTFGRPFFECTDEHWHRICRYLELPTEIEPVLAFTDWLEYTKTLEPEEQEIIKADSTEPSHPFSEEAIPFVRQWLDENDAALDMFITAAQKPVLYVPPMFGESLYDTLLTTEDVCRRMTRAIQIRIRYRLSVGEIDKAWGDVLVMYRIGELHRRSVWIVVSSLVNTAMLGAANRSAEAVLLHSDWSAEEIRRKVEEIMLFQRPWSEEEIRMIFRNERLMALDSLTHMVNGTFGFNDHCCGPTTPDAQDQFNMKIMMRVVRMGTVMVKVNRRFDEVEQWYFSDDPVLPEIKLPDRYDQLKMLAWYGFIGTLRTLLDYMASEFSSLHSIEAWQTSNKGQEADSSLTRLVFALEAYHRDNGSYPAALDDLLGHDIDEIPLDPFSKEPFRYILEEPGYLLYSVGPNGIDEDGRDRSDDPRGDDTRRRVPVPLLAEKQG